MAPSHRSSIRHDSQKRYSVLLIRQSVSVCRNGTKVRRHCRLTDRWFLVKVVVNRRQTESYYSAYTFNLHYITRFLLH